MGLTLQRCLDGRPAAAHHAGGRQEQDVAHEGARKPLQQGRKLGTDALEGGGWGEQREQNLRPHGFSIPRLASRVAARRPGLYMPAFT